MSQPSGNGLPSRSEQPYLQATLTDYVRNSLQYSQFPDEVLPHDLLTGDADAWMRWANGVTPSTQGTPEENVTNVLQAWTALDDRETTKLDEDLPINVADPEPVTRVCAQAETQATNCPYCQDVLQADDDTTVHQLGCGQVLHTKCFNDALERGDGKCPLCREPIAQPLTPEQRWVRFNSIFECPERQQANLPGYCAQCHLWQEVTHLRSTYQVRVDTLREEFEERRRHLEQRLSLNLQLLRQKHIRTSRKFEMEDDKRVLQGKERKFGEGYRLEVRLSDEFDEFRNNIRLAVEQKFDAMQIEHLRLEQEEDEYFRHKVEMAWQIMRKQKEEDAQGSEWEEIPFPI